MYLRTDPHGNNLWPPEWCAGVWDVRAADPATPAAEARTPVKPFTPARKEPGRFIPCSMCENEPICICAVSMK